MEIGKLGRYIEKHKRSAVIFPEGTRSKTGIPKKFHTTGLKVLLKKAPTAIIIPISINNSWKMLKFGKFPYGLCNHITFDVHKPLENNADVELLIEKVEKTITEGLIPSV